MTWPGEEQTWIHLTGLDPGEVQRKARVNFNQGHSFYELTSFGQQINVSLPDRSFSGFSNISNILLNELADFSRLSILNYLVHAREVPLTGQLVRPADLSGGDLFARGTHILPLDKIADLFNNDKETFFIKGRELGGSQIEYGDMSLRLFPFPRIPVVMIVWSGDDEFPPRSSLLFDSSCAYHIPIDILWSTAMLTVGMMLHQGNN